MTRSIQWAAVLAPAALVALAADGLAQQGTPPAAAAVTNPREMTFFVTSSGPGRGADLGGLAGADALASPSPGPWAGTPAGPGAPTSAPAPRGAHLR